MANTVFTIGYEKFTIEEYTEKLKEAKVTTLIDVREKAWSRKRDFCKTRFQNYLSKHGIRYLHLPKAGNPSSIRKSSKNTTEVLKKYSQYLRQNKSVVTELLNEIETGNGRKKDVVCLTCVEDDFTCCHRSILTNSLVSKRASLKIKHLN